MGRRTDIHVRLVVDCVLSFPRDPCSDKPENLQTRQTPQWPEGAALCVTPFEITETISLPQDKATVYPLLILSPLPFTMGPTALGSHSAGHHFPLCPQPP